MLRGTSASITREIVPTSRLPAIRGKSWAELESFFTRERQSEGRTYKKEVINQMHEYRGWVYDAVDCIVDRLCSVGFKFYRRDTFELFSSTSPYYKAVTKPILYPNDFMTFRFIKGWCQTQLDLCGKAAILKIRNALGKPWELWPLDMNFFEGIEWDTKNLLKPPRGVKFKINDKVYLFPMQNVIWLRYPHPESLWDGFSPIQAQAYVTDIDYYLEVYERGFFKNSARVDFILEHEGNLDEEGAARLKEQWMAAYGGIKRSYQPVIASGGLKVVPISLSNKDFQFVDLARWTKERILSAYRVPEGKLGLFRDINRANQKGIDIAFNEGCILPRCGLWDEEISKQLIWEITPRVIMVHDNPVPRDREMDLKELEMRKDMYAVNENRNWWDGSKPVEGGDVILVSKNTIPLTSISSIDTGDATDKPGDEETPEYDTEHDPGGDESDKAITFKALPYFLDNKWEKHLDPLMKTYKKAMDYTNGWPYWKAAKKAEEFAINMGDKIKKLFVYCVRNGLEAEQFKSNVIKHLNSELMNKISSKKGG